MLAAYLKRLCDLQQRGDAREADAVFAEIERETVSWK